MSATWREDDEEFRVGGVKGGGGLRSKPRFSYTEVKMLLEAVKRNRFIILRKFNQGVSAETKKQTWTEITNQINGLGENHREVRQIMKKWADLKCDGKRRIAALRGPNGSNMRKKNLGAVEKMVHKILMMSPRAGGDSDLELGEDDDLSNLYAKGLPPPTPTPYSYLSLTDNPHSLELSPLSSPEKEHGGDPFHSSSDFDLELGDDGERTMDLEENDDSLFSSVPSALPPLPPPPPPPASASLDPLPDDVLLRVKPVFTYSRNNSQNNNHIQNHNYSRPTPGPSTSSGFPSASDPEASASSLPAPPPTSSSTANDSSSHPAPSSSSAPPPPPAASSSSGAPVTAAPSSSAGPRQPPPSPPSTRPSNPADPLPAGASSHRSRDTVSQVASQSLQQQRASRMLLTSVSRSLETLAQSVQLLVESQQEFVQESLLLQRETVDILRDFSGTALTMLRDKANSGHHHPPPSHF